MHRRFSVVSCGILVTACEESESGGGESGGTGGTGGTAGVGGAVGNGDSPKEWGDAALIESNPGDATNAQLTVDPSGNALAVGSESDGTDRNIWSNRFQ